MTGILKLLPDGSLEEVSKACGENNSNYDAEVAAIENTLILLETQMQIYHDKDIMIFTDAMSALESLDEVPVSKPELKTIIVESHELIETCDVKIFMQWILGHSDTPGNDKAEK